MKKKSISDSNYKSCYKLSGAIDYRVRLLDLFTITSMFASPNCLSLFNCMSKLAVIFLSNLRVNQHTEKYHVLHLLLLRADVLTKLFKKKGKDEKLMTSG